MFIEIIIRVEDKYIEHFTALLQRLNESMTIRFYLTHDIKIT